MSRENILVVEDEEDIQQLLCYNLIKEGYHVACVSSGEKALSEAAAKLPDLILLDLMLPGVDGFEVCRFLKKDAKTQQIPIIMVTAKGEESDIVTGLELGASDYVTKPFSPKVLIARIRGALRKKNLQAAEDESLKIDRLEIHPGRHEVLIENKPVEMTFTEYSILLFLVSRPGWVFTRNQIVDAVHGDDYPVTDRSVDVQIVGLRKKLGKMGNYIVTVRGVGYRFKSA